MQSDPPTDITALNETVREVNVAAIDELTEGMAARRRHIDSFLCGCMGGCYHIIVTRQHLINKHDTEAHMLSGWRNDELADYHQDAHQ
jgi:hypothetical protein